MMRSSCFTAVEVHSVTAEIGFAEPGLLFTRSELSEARLVVGSHIGGILEGPVVPLGKGNNRACVGSAVFAGLPSGQAKRYCGIDLLKLFFLGGVIPPSLSGLI